MANTNKCIKALLHPTGGHQGSHKAHRAGLQSYLPVITHGTPLSIMVDLHAALVWPTAPDKTDCK